MKASSFSGVRLSTEEMSIKKSSGLTPGSISCPRL